MSFGYVNTKCLNIRDIKFTATYKLYPNIQLSETCTLMLLTNLAEPEWIQIGCSQNILASVICMQDKRNKSNLKAYTPQRKQLITKCPSLSVSKKNECFIFQWIDTDLTITPLSLNNISFLTFVFDAIVIKFPPILAPVSGLDNKMHKFFYTKILNTYQFTRITIDSHKADGFFISSSERLRIESGSNTFFCASGSYISQLYICDGNVDCPYDNSDEMLAFCKNITNILKKKSSSVDYQGNLHYIDAKGNYQKFLIPEEREIVLDESKFTCNNSMFHHPVFQDDLVADCGPEGEDELILVSMLTTNAYTKCKYPGELPCREGHSKCYNITDICIYRLDIYSHNIPCRTGDHLQNCKEYECDTTFKCHQSYCIPWSYVNDGKWDCPKGEDEVFQSDVCIHMYKCKIAQICVHLASLCDSQIDCPLGDDEILCGLKNTKCILFCQCLAYALYCQNAGARISFIPYPFISISLVDVTPTLANGISKYFPNCLYIKLNRNSLTDVCHDFVSPTVILFDIKFNKISNISTGCFIFLFDLKAIYLDYNSIVSVNPLSFVSLFSLKVLSLSNNPLYSFANNVFLKTSAIELVSIKYVELTNVNAFKSLKVKLFETSDFHFCCIAPCNSQCSQNIPWFSSCSDLLPKVTMKICWIGVLILVFITNFISILICTWFDCLGTIFQKVVYSINFTDLIFVIYLSIIWFTDRTNIGNFMLYEEKWKADKLCFAAFGIITWFSISIQCFLIFGSLTRLMVVIYPLETKFNSMQFISKYLSLIFITSVCLVLSAIFTIKDKVINIPTYLCLPFVDPTKSVIELNALTWFVAVTQFLTSIVILFLHVHLVKQLEKSQQFLKNVKSDVISHSSLEIQLTILTVSNFLCWIPCNIIFVLTMFLPKYPMALVIWTVVGILPLRSIITPSVFIITSIKKMLKSKKAS